MPVVQLTTHVKRSTLYSRTVIWLYGRTVVWSYGHTLIWSYCCTVVRSYGRMGIRPYNQIFLAWWVTTILYNYGATLCKLCYKSYFFLWMNQKLTKWSSQEIEIEKEAQKKSQAWTGFKLSCDRHKLNPYQSLEKASFPITILIAV